MESKTVIKISVGAIALIIIIGLIGGFVGFNNEQNWQYLQGISGGQGVQETGGFYVKGFAKSTTYPRFAQVEYDSRNKKMNWSIKVTFNDGGWAEMDTIIRFAMPPTREGKIAFHQLFGGNMENVEAAVWAHMSDCMKSSGPLMSASEHQSARRAEFNQVSQEQLNLGLYEMKKVERPLLDQTDEKGKPITVYATEIVSDTNGKPKISKPSPLSALGIIVTQFSITDVRYDEQTQKQFMTKKDAFLAAENSKAQREKEVQERLMVTEKGLREKAEVEAQANKVKAEQVINAQREKEVAELNAQRELVVARLTKERAEVSANQLLEVARIERQASEEDAKRVITLANAEKEKIALAGAITEEKRVLAEIQRDKEIGIARELSKIAVPSTVISGGTGSGANLQDNLVNIALLKSLGIIPDVKPAPVTSKQ